MSIDMIDMIDIVNQIEQDIPKDHIALVTDEDMKSLIEYYKNGKAHTRSYIDIDVRYMRLAREFSTWSKDPSSKIGSIAISANNQVVLSQGYNGFPRKIKDDYRLCIKSIKYDYIVHAEMNMIYNAVDNGVSLAGSTVYVYGLPVCSQCTSGLIQAGVVRIVYCNVKNDPRWNESFKISASKMIEAGIEYKELKVEDLD